MTHVCVTMKVSVPRRVSQATSFEISFSKTVLDDMGVPILRPSLCVGGWIMHMQFVTDVVNSLAWTRESPMPDKNPDRWIFEMIDTWISFQWMCPTKPRHGDDIMMHG